VNRPVQQPRRQRGITLIEVLVTLVVFSVGALGLAGLQATGLRNNRDAYVRTQVTVLANDIADRLRANVTGIQNGNYNNQSGSATSSCNTASGCTSSQMAANDLAEWNALAAALLPSGAGVVCLDSTPDDGTSGSAACDNSGAAYAIKIWWDDDHDSTTAARRFVTAFKPQP